MKKKCQKVTYFLYVWGVLTLSAYGEEITPPLTCNRVLRDFKLKTYPDARVQPYCERAILACQMHKMTQIMRRKINRMPDGPTKQQRLKDVTLLEENLRQERQTYLVACRFAYNFFSNPDDVEKFLEPGM